MRLSINIVLFALAIFFSGCEDIVNVKLDNAPQMNVDGNINYYMNLPANAQPADTIKLSITPGYLDPGPSVKIKDAVITVSDNEGFSEILTNLNDGNYVTTTLIPKIGNSYFLNIKAQGEEFTAQTKLNPVATIDSVVPDHRVDELFGRVKGYYINLFANDLPGVGNYYRLKVFKNGILFNKASDLTIAQDAHYYDIAGQGPDGTRFTFPIREALNPRVDKDTIINGKKTTKAVAPFEVGNKVKVEIHSLTKEHALFYTEIQTQITNADQGLFASPYANVSTNIININPQGKKAVGWFGASAIATDTITIK